LRHGVLLKLNGLCFWFADCFYVNVCLVQALGCQNRPAPLTLLFMYW